MLCAESKILFFIEKDGVFYGQKDYATCHRNQAKEGDLFTSRNLYSVWNADTNGHIEGEYFNLFTPNRTIPLG